RPPGQQKLPLCGEISRSTRRLRLSQMRRQTSRGVARRRAYRICVRNVSACSTDRQQESADLQVFKPSPRTRTGDRLLTMEVDVLGGRAGDGGLPAWFPCIDGGFATPFDLFLEPP